MADAFSRLAATLAGTAPPAMLTRAEAIADRLARAAAVLRETGDPELVEMADGLDRWRHEGGDLAAALGARARHGRRHDLPASAAREQAKRQAVHQMALSLGLGAERPALAAKVLATFLARPVGVHILREVEQGVEVPRSAAQLTRILRSMK